MPIKEKRIQVGLNTTALLSPRTGIGNYVYELGKQLLTSDIVEPRFFYGKDWSSELRAAPLAHINTIKQWIKRLTPRAYDVSRYITQRGFSAGISSNSKIDLYHEPNYLAYAFNGPTVVTVHDLSWIRYPELHPVERVRAIERYFPRSLDQAAAIITDCEYVRAEVIDVFGVAPAKVHSVPLGASSAYRPIPREQSQQILAAHGLEFGNYLLSVGTLEPRKNLVTIIDAFLKLDSRIQEQYPLVLVGMKGWLTDSLQTKMDPLINRGLVKSLGFVPDEQMPALYSGAAAFLYPSLYEGFGLPPLEAMACGAPVIVSNSSSLPEVVGDAGILIDPKDSDGFAEAISHIVQDTALQQGYSKKSVARATTFSWKKTADETIKVYQRVLGR